MKPSGDEVFSFFVEGFIYEFDYLPHIGLIILSVSPHASFDKLSLARSLFVLSKLLSLLAWCCLKIFFIIIVVLSGVIFPLSSLILVIYDFPGFLA